MIGLLTVVFLGVWFATGWAWAITLAGFAAGVLAGADLWRLGRRVFRRRRQPAPPEASEPLSIWEWMELQSRRFRERDERGEG